MDGETITRGTLVRVQMTEDQQVKGRIERILPDGNYLVSVGLKLYSCKPEIVTRAQNDPARYRRDLFGGV